MQKIRCTFTVYFENPFWVGVYERFEHGKLSVSKITFGAEPKDYEVYEFMLENWGNLKFSKPRKSDEQASKKINPKRMQREIQKRLSSRGVSTKSQLAIKEQQDENKLERKVKNRDKKLQEQQRKFQLRTEKRKKKRKGR